MNRTRFASALAMAALAAILLPSNLHAQITFQRTYGGPDYDECYSIQQTADGGYIVTGETFSNVALGGDLWLIKTDARGNEIWAKTLNRDTVDGGRSVRQTSDGGYIIAGRTGGSYGGGRADVWLVKTDADGDKIWDRTFGGNGVDLAYCVQQTSDGGYIVVGCYEVSGFSNVYLIRIDANGDSVWSKTIGGVDTDNGYSVVQTRDSGFAIAGATASLGTGGLDVYLIKTDRRGDIAWTKTYGGTDDDAGYSIQQTADDGFVIAGFTDSADSEGVYIIKTDANGDTLWTRTYVGTWDVGTSVRQTADGGYIVAGWTYSLGAETDFYLIKTTAAGDTLWTRAFGGTDHEEGYSMEQTDDGGFVIAGSTMSYGAGYWDFYLVKTDSVGRVAVAEPKASPTRAPTLGLTCEPNPCRSSTVLHLTAGPLDHSTTVLRIYDSQGRLVLSREVSTSSFPLSTSDLPSGAYFLRCDVAGQHATARLVLQR